MRRLHVLADLRNRDIEIQIVAKNRAGNKHDKHRERRVLKICDLNLHRSELDAPSDIDTCGWGLEAHVLPVCGLEVLEVVGFGEVEGFEVFGEDDDGVADEEVGEVSGEAGVHAAVHELLFDVLVND